VMVGAALANTSFVDGSAMVIEENAASVCGVGSGTKLHAVKKIIASMSWRMVREVNILFSWDWVWCRDERAALSDHP
jgi:hypothetical protein